jgi:hypothetical protein
MQHKSAKLSRRYKAGRSDVLSSSTICPFPRRSAPHSTPPQPGAAKRSMHKWCTGKALP